MDETQGWNEGGSRGQWMKHNGGNEGGSRGQWMKHEPEATRYQVLKPYTVPHVNHSLLGFHSLRMLEVYVALVSLHVLRAGEALLETNTSSPGAHSVPVEKQHSSCSRNRVERALPRPRASKAQPATKPHWLGQRRLRVATSSGVFVS